jgi:hypothetical protein
MENRWPYCIIVLLFFGLIFHADGGCAGAANDVCLYGRGMEFSTVGGGCAGSADPAKCSLSQGFEDSIESCGISIEIATFVTDTVVSNRWKHPRKTDKRSRPALQSKSDRHHGT